MNIDKNGETFIVDDNHQRFWEDFNNNDWEVRTFEIIDYFVDKEHSMIDIGAWIGPVSLYGARKAKHCYSIEPDPVAFMYLKINKDKNNIKNMTTHEHALWHINGPLILKCIEWGDSQSSYFTGPWKNKDKIKVNAITPKRFMDAHSIEDCNFIKMDIEGAEMRVLYVMKELILKYKPTMLISLHFFKFGNPKFQFENVKEALKPYKYIYDKDGELLDMECLLNTIPKMFLTEQSFDIVATDKEWI
ncbi:MAG: FkbM family methyltransferase [bacterium]|nr:FkbM family methyltransferase [bacterium]